MSIRGYVSAQRFNARVRWERNLRTDTASGGTRDNWLPMLTSRAAVDAMKANEQVIDGGIRNPNGYTVWIRADVLKRIGLTALDRGVWLRPSGDTILSITGIPDQGLEGRLIAVFCAAGVNAG
jgi:head-tail adaptor